MLHIICSYRLKWFECSAQTVHHHRRQPGHSFTRVTWCKTWMFSQLQVWLAIVKSINHRESPVTSRANASANSSTSQSSCVSSISLGTEPKHFWKECHAVPDGLQKKSRERVVPQIPRLVEIQVTTDKVEGILSSCRSLAIATHHKFPGKSFLAQTVTYRNLSININFLELSQLPELGVTRVPELLIFLPRGV
jgi:hypothetical protein